MRVEDEEIMLTIAAGQTERMEELILRHQQRLYGYLLRVLRNTAEAEEAFQDVWLRVFESRARYVKTAKFTTWLYRIATNLCIDRFRRAKPTLAVETAGDRAESGAGSVVLAETRRGPADEVERTELSEAIRTAVYALPDGQREVFLLAEGEGLAYDEIAEILSIPVGTVKSRMHHATRGLRGALGKHR